MKIFEKVIANIKNIYTILLFSVIFEELGLSLLDLEQIFKSNNRLFVALKGATAEHHLFNFLKKITYINNVEKLDKDGQPDFKFEFNGKSYLLECKNVLSKSKMKPKIDFKKTRVSKNDETTRYYSKEQFQILAGCLYPITGKWDFKFCLTKDLPKHEKFLGKISCKVYLDETWTENLEELLKRD